MLRVVFSVFQFSAEVNIELINMSAVGSLVPARFLTIIAHLVIVITIFWSRVS